MRSTTFRTLFFAAIFTSAAGCVDTMTGALGGDDVFYL